MPASSTLILQDRMLQLGALLDARILGQQRLCHRMLVTLLADGHILVEGPSGPARTCAV
jgi:MoxR-like ATPase